MVQKILLDQSRHNYQKTKNNFGKQGDIMAKNGSNVVRWAGIGLTVAIMAAGIIGSFITGQAETKAVGVRVTVLKENVRTLKTDGCVPANLGKFDIALVQKDISTIQSDLATMKQDSKEGLEKILERLPER